MIRLSILTSLFLCAFLSAGEPEAPALPKPEVLKLLASDKPDDLKAGAKLAFQDPEIIAALRKAYAKSLKPGEEKQPVFELLGAIRKLDARDALPEVIESISHTNWRLANFAIDVAVQWKATKAIPAIRLAMQSTKESALRTSAALALAAFNIEEGWSQLKVLVKSTDDFVRSMIAGSLGDVADPRAIEVLIGLLEDKGRTISISTGMIENGQRAQRSLAKLTGENFGRNKTAWTNWWQARAGKLPVVPEPNKALQDLLKEDEAWQKHMKQK